MPVPHHGWLVLLAASSFVVFPFILAGGVTLNHAQAKATAFLLGGLLLLGWMLLPTWWLRAGLVLGVLSAIVSGLRAWALAPLMAYLIWGTAVGWVQGLDARAWRTVRRIITVAAVIQAVWMSWQWVTTYAGDPLYWPSLGLFALKMTEIKGVMTVIVSGPIGFFGNPTDAGLFLGLALPFALTWWAAGLIASGMLLSGSGVATAMLAVVGLWWFLRRWRWWMLPAGAGALVGLAVLYVGWLDPAWAGGSLQGRLAVWDQALMLSAQAPWLGWGWGSLGTRLHLIWATERWVYLHNEWLQLLLEGGAVALVLAVTVTGLLIERIWKQRIRDERVGGLLALGVAATLGIPFRLAPAALLGAVWVGGLLREESA